MIGQALRVPLLTECAVPALSYHKIDEIPPSAHFRCNYVRPEAFAAQLRWLRRAGFETISLAAYAGYRKGTTALPARPIMITFDDGYASNHSIAVPLLERYGFRATFFVVTDYIGATNSWDADETQEPLLSHRQLREMHAAGFEIQSHTRTHPRLSGLDPAQLRDELAGSRQALQELLQSPVNVIAYPWSDYNHATIEMAQETGYDAGVMLRRRANFPDTPMHELRRIGVNHETRLSRFLWDLLRLRWRGA